MTTIKERMGAALKTARDIAAKAEAEGREMTGEEVASANAALIDYKAAKVEFEKFNDSQALKDALAAIGDDLGLERTEQPNVKATAFAQRPKLKTLGEMFVESEAYKGMMSQFAEGRINEKARVQSAPFGVKGIVTGASDTSGGAFVTTDRQGDFELLGRRPLTVRDLVSVRQTTSDTVDFVQQTTQMSSADVVAEATSSAAPTTGASSGAALTLATGGGYKPEGSLAFQTVTATVKTIAEWIPATKRGLADASQLKGLIDQELKEDLAQKEEDQILNGSGSGENITGILNTSGIQTQALSSTTAGVDPRSETILKAKTKVRTVGRSVATGVLINPTDWEAITLARLAKNPNNDGDGTPVQRIHGLAVVESEAIAAGTALIGDYRKAVIWDREQASITATDSHADFFIRNLVAILGEERLAFGVLRPKAFVKATIA